MSLTFKQMQDMTLEDAFPEAKRADVQEWIRERHTELWDAEPWVFRDTIATVSVVGGVVSGVSDVGDVFSLYDNTGSPLQPFYDTRQFYDRYNSALTSGGVPEAFCVVGNQIVVAPASGTLTGYQLAYRKTRPALTADNSTTGFPDGYDMAFVYGAKAVGFTLINNPFADDYEARFQAKKEALRNSYVSGISRVGVQTPAYRPYVGW